MPILIIFDLEKEAILETNTLDFTIGAYLTQKGNNNKLRAMAYYSHKMIGLELNYNIYDKELLAIVKALREWRVYLEGMITPIQIYIDYKNLLYQMTTKQLNRRQVRQAKTLTSYLFKINHIYGTKNRKVDTLSRQPNYLEGSKLGVVSIL